MKSTRFRNEHEYRRSPADIALLYVAYSASAALLVAWLGGALGIWR